MEKPHRSPRASRAAAYLLAACVHALTLAFLVVGVVTIATDVADPFAWLFGLALIFAAIGMRPRVPRLDGSGRPAGERLIALTARVAQALGRPAPDLVLVTGEWNASWRVVGWRRRRVLTIGLPLWVALEPQERVAVLAHELGHDRANDAQRSLIVGSALNALHALMASLQAPSQRPEEDLDLVRYGELLPVAGGLAGVLMWLVSRPVALLLWLQARLLFADMRRAEYLADDAAASVAGTAAAIGLHERARLRGSFAYAVQNAAVNPGVDPFVRLREVISHAVPEPERVGPTHPPAARRIAALATAPERPPALVLPWAEAEAIDAELAALEASVGRELVDAYRWSLR